MVSEPQRRLQRQPGSLHFLPQEELDAIKNLLAKERTRQCRTRDRLELTAPGTHGNEVCSSCSLLPSCLDGGKTQLMELPGVTLGAVGGFWKEYFMWGNTGVSSHRNTRRIKPRLLRRQLSAVPPHLRHRA